MGGPKLRCDPSFPWESRQDTARGRLVFRVIARSVERAVFSVTSREAALPARRRVGEGSFEAIEPGTELRELALVLRLQVLDLVQQHGAENVVLDREGTARFVIDDEVGKELGDLLGAESVFGHRRSAIAVVAPRNPAMKVRFWTSPIRIVEPSAATPP